MKKLLSYLFACSVLFTACNNKQTTSANAEDVIQEAKETTAIVAKEGRGKITLECKGKTYEINGVCGAITSMGSVSIAIPDDSVKAKVFTINFIADKLPESSSAYTIVDYNNEDKDASHVSVDFTDMRSTQQMSWDSNDKSGRLDFTVNGDEIKCTFSNLTLQPSMMYNKGEQDAPATVSGEFTIYKN